MVRDRLMETFTAPEFRQAFRLYFLELGCQVKDWERLFREMDGDGRGNRAFLREDGGQAVGFIQFCMVELESWFFRKKMGFIREFWVAPAYRGQGHGKALLAKAEGYLKEAGAGGVLLTTDTAAGFYQRQGYRPDPYMQAKNHDPVYGKDLP